MIDGGRKVGVAAQLARGAGLPRLGVGNGFDLAFDRVGEAQDQQGAIGRRHARPRSLVEGAPRRGDGGGNVAGRGVRDRADHCATCGVAQVEAPVALGGA